MNIYFDHNATTPIDPRVVSIMRSLEELPLNPSSMHMYGRKARKHLQIARKQIADRLSIPESVLYFCSGATEAVNTLLQGFSRTVKAHIISSKLEHSCIRQTVSHLEKTGVSVTYLPLENAPNAATISLEALEKTLSHFPGKNTLVALSSVNSETGAMLPLEEAARLCAKYEAHFLVDSVAQVGKEPLFMYEGISAMCFSPHKFYGPKGIGFFYAKELFPFSPLLYGGSQEKQRRAGTENILGAVGAAKAFSLAIDELPTHRSHMLHIREMFESRIQTFFPQLMIHAEKKRTCNVSALAFPNIDAETLFIRLDQEGFAASLGSACSSGAVEPFPALLAMGLDEKIARASIRFSFGRGNTLQEVTKATSCIENILKQISGF